MQTKPIDPQLHELFEKLNDDVVDLSWKWQVFRGLFRMQERIDLLNATAPSFFGLCQRTFADDMFMMIGRLTDTPQTRGQDNLVITRLIDGVDQAQDPDFHRNLKTLTDAAFAACSSFKQHRHKRLAHNDLNARLQVTPNLLPSISFDQINTAIEALQHVLNEFKGHYFDSETSYKVFDSGGTKALVTFLEKGLVAFKAEEEQRLGSHGLTTS